MRSAFLELISEYPFPVVSRLGVRWFPTVAIKFLQKPRLRDTRCARLLYN